MRAKFSVDYQAGKQQLRSDVVGLVEDDSLKLGLEPAATKLSVTIEQVRHILKIVLQVLASSPKAKLCQGHDRKASADAVDGS